MSINKGLTSQPEGNKLDAEEAVEAKVGIDDVDDERGFAMLKFLLKKNNGLITDFLFFFEA